MGGGGSDLQLRDGDLPRFEPSDVPPTAGHSWEPVEPPLLGSCGRWLPEVQPSPPPPFSELPLQDLPLNKFGFQVQALLGVWVKMRCFPFLQFLCSRPPGDWREPC